MLIIYVRAFLLLRIACNTHDRDSDVKVTKEYSRKAGKLSVIKKMNGVLKVILIVR